MWRRVSCEQLLHKSQSILSPRRNPKRMVAVNVTAVCPRGLGPEPAVSNYFFFH